MASEEALFFYTIIAEKLKRIKVSFFPGFIWLFISTILFCLPGSTLPSNPLFDKLFVDKWVHVALFAIMVTLWCWPYTTRIKAALKLRTVFVSIAIIAAFYGVVMEIIQLNFIPNRSFDIGDILADTCGSIAGLVFSNQRFIKK